MVQSFQEQPLYPLREGFPTRQLFGPYFHGFSPTWQRRIFFHGYKIALTKGVPPFNLFVICIPPPENPTPSCLPNLEPLCVLHKRSVPTTTACRVHCLWSLPPSSTMSLVAAITTLLNCCCHRSLQSPPPSDVARPPSIKSLSSSCVLSLMLHCYQRRSQ
jgi:hypothetical protein